MLFLSPTSSPIPGIKVLLADSRYFRLVILAIEAVRNVDYLCWWRLPHMKGPKAANMPLCSKP